jgi:sugar O-acyltransferase (sialic acid O-acetyltransferase NeuD family)
MTKPKLILIGAGGHARSCIDVIEQQGNFEIAGLVGLPEQGDGKGLAYGYNIIGGDSDLYKLSKIYKYALIAVGQIQNSENRIRLYLEATQLGFQFPTIVSRTAYVSQYATIGSGTVVMHGSIVNAGAKVGDNCIVNCRTLIEHDAQVADHCHISTGAILNGNVTVGSGSFIGSGSVIKQGVSIGKNCLVGMGLGVRHDLADSNQLRGLMGYEQ